MNEENYCDKLTNISILDKYILDTRKHSFDVVISSVNQTREEEVMTQLCIIKNNIIRI